MEVLVKESLFRKGSGTGPFQKNLGGFKNNAF